MPTQTEKSWKSQPKTWVEKTRGLLAELGINNETLNAIQEKYPELVQMLNDFALISRPTETWGRTGTFDISPLSESASRYNPFLHQVLILRKNLEPDISFPGYNQQYMAVAHLAHEVTHAFQGTNEDPRGGQYSNAIEYAKAMTAGEGEALYYEIIALYRLYGKNDDSTTNDSAINTLRLKACRNGSWKEGAAQPSAVASMFAELFAIVRPDLFEGDDDPQRAAKIEALQEKNATMIGGLIGSNEGIPLTYDEINRWYLLVETANQPCL